MAPENGNRLLQATGVRVRFPTRFGWITAVDGVDIGIERGETLALVGESGSGKSVLCLALMGLLPSDGQISGRVEFDKNSLDCAKPGDWTGVRGRRMAMVFQEPLAALNPVMTAGRQVGEAVAVGRNLRGVAARELAEQLLESMDVPDPAGCLKKFPHELSGGLRQRVMMAMALAGRPSLLIADEPTTALDVTVQAQVVNLFRRLVRSEGMSALFVSHDLALVAGLADRIAVMYAGSLVELAAVSDMFREPLHPYTRALLEAAEGAQSFTTIPGDVPDPLDLPPGCRFAPRCPLVIDRCRVALPELRSFTDGRLARCIRAGEVS